MPTTIPFLSHDANAELLRSDLSARQANRDLLVVATITGVGLLLTIGLAVLFPLAANAISLALSVT